MRARLRRSRALRAVLLAAAALALLSGCGGGGGGKGKSSAAVTKGTFVGRVSGTNAYIALVSDGRRVSGYLCDGRRISFWLGATSVANGRVELVTRRGLRLGEAILSKGSATGTVNLAGREADFAARVATGRAGLYHAVKGTPGRSGFKELGWIILPDGSQRGGSNLNTDTGNVLVSEAPKLDPANPIQGLDVCKFLSSATRACAQPPAGSQRKPQSSSSGPSNSSG